MFGTEIGAVALRMAIIFTIGLVVVRMMGNRTVGQLSPFDFVLMVGIGDIIAGVAMQDNKAIAIGAEALIGILLLQQLIAWVSLKNATARKWFEGIPITLIEDGKIVMENLKKNNFNLDDLRQELHKNGLDMENLSDVKIARLESCGDVSVILRQEAEPFSRRYFQHYIKELYDNPLSSTGKTTLQLEQLMADLDTISGNLHRLRIGKPSNCVKQQVEERKHERL